MQVKSVCHYFWQTLLECNKNAPSPNCSNIAVPDTKQYNIGKYGRLHKKFLEENYPAYYSTLLMTGKLLEHLEKIDCKARNELDRLIPIFAEQQGATEQLKAENQLKWVGLMNDIKAQVEEIIYAEIVYVRNENFD